MIKKYLKVLIVLVLIFLLTFSYTYTFAEEANEENVEINTELVEGEQQETQDGTMPISNEGENTQDGTTPISDEGENTQAEDNNQSTEENEVTDETTDNSEYSDEQISADVSNLKSSDIYLKGDEITIDYPIDGNLYVIANKVTVNSEIGGDAFILTKELNIEKEGYIYSNLFALSNNIKIDGVIYDMYAVAKNISITSDGSVNRDARIVASEEVSIKGYIGRNAFIGGDSKLSFSKDSSDNSSEDFANINGDLIYYTSEDVSNEDFSSSVSGNISVKKSSSMPVSTGNVVVNHLKTLANKLILIAVIWLICLWIAPKYLKNCGTAFTNKPVASTLLGLLVIVVTPILAVILLLTKVATIASLLLLALLGLLLVISSSIFAITLGNIIGDKINKDSKVFSLLMSIAVGLVFYLVNLIPVIGTIVSVIIIILGLGSIISYLVNNRNQTANG